MTDQIHQWRRERLEVIDRCDICGKASEVIHEIARGTGNRQLALNVPACQLVLCTNCHTGPKGVHDGGYSVAEQLAWLKFRRPDEFNVEIFYKLTARRWPDLDAITAAYRLLRRLTRKD